jgi:hypothetical protein
MNDTPKRLPVYKRVRLTTDIGIFPGKGLPKGMEGVIIEVREEPEFHYIVEFILSNGADYTIGLEPHQVEPIKTDNQTDK